MASRLLQCTRRFSTNKALCGASLSDPLVVNTEAAHSAESYKKWRSLCLFVCIPVCLIHGIYTLSQEEKPRPEFKKYAHLRIRNKKYPWRDGVKTLFHGHNNALPDGYEDDGH